MAIVSPPATAEAPVTVEDYLALGEGPPYYELYAGDLHVDPAPSTAHQRILRNLTVLLTAACPAHLEVLFAPVDWVIDRHNVCQPDVLVAARAAIGPAKLTATPELAVEVLSPATRHHDLVHKRTLYERAGLPNYWLIDPGTDHTPAKPVTLTVLQRNAAGHLAAAATATGEAPASLQQPFPVTVVPAQLLS